MKENNTKILQLLLQWILYYHYDNGDKKRFLDFNVHTGSHAHIHISVYMYIYIYMYVYKHIYMYVSVNIYSYKGNKTLDSLSSGEDTGMLAILD